MATPHNYVNDPLQTHSWNASRSKIALSPNNSEVHIYDVKTGQQEHLLDDHTQRVNCIDWAKRSDKIVTCGSDRNAFVWAFEDNKWKPSLVALRVNRAATYCRWSPAEKKFAVATGSKLISVCYLDVQHNFWISKHIKKPIKSTVTCLSWHPNEMLLACGSTDKKVRIFSALIKEVDDRATNPGPWVTGDKLGFADIIAEFETPGTGGSWIHDVAFSPSGDTLAWVSHDSTICVVSSSNPKSVAFVRTALLPFTCCMWLNESLIVAAGYNCAPYVFTYDQATNKISEPRCVDKQHQNNSNEANGNGSTANFSATLTAFRGMDSRAQADNKDLELKTVHQNTITSVVPHTMNGNEVSFFSTSGLDGQIVVWNWRTLEQSMATMQI